MSTLMTQSLISDEVEIFDNGLMRGFYTIVKYEGGSHKSSREMRYRSKVNHNSRKS